MRLIKKALTLSSTLTQWRFLNIQTLLPSPGGYIVVKENVTSSGEVERDEEDR